MNRDHDAGNGDGQDTRRLLRQQIKRGRTGCFTCRRRRKKCDETKPECIGCLRSGYICEGYPATTQYQPAQPRLRPRKQDQAPPTSPRSAGPGVAEVLLQESLPEALPESLPAPPESLQSLETQQMTSSFGFAGSELADWFAVGSPDMSFASYSSASVPVPMLDACPPEVDPLLFASLDVSWHPPPSPCRPQPLPPQPETLARHSLSSPSSPSTRLARRRRSPLSFLRRGAHGIPRGLPFLINGIDSAAERAFFAHFATTTSKVLTIETNDSNPLLTNILPRSLQEPMIQKAVLCLGASHLLKLQPQPTERSMLAEKDALLRHTEQELTMRIAATKVPANKGGSPARLPPPSELDAILSTTLLLCLHEISEGSGDVSWIIHLNVARDLIQAVMDAAHEEEQGPDEDANGQPQIDGFLLEFFLYHDVLAMVTDQARVPVLSSWRRRKQGGTTKAGAVTTSPASPSSSPESAASPRQVAPGGADMAVSSQALASRRAYMIGVDNGLFDLVLRVAALATKAKDVRVVGTTTTSSGSVIYEALQLWDELDGWQREREATGGAGGPPADAASTPSNESLVCSAYVAALFVWLYAIVYPADVAHAKVRDAVRAGLADMEQIGPGGGALAFLLFPTFVLGFASITADERAQCAAQFERLRAFSGLGNVSLARALVRQSWAAYDRGEHGTSWDWMAQMQRQGVSVPVT